MSYQVWFKDEFEGWRQKECADVEAAKEELLLAIKAGKEPMLTEEVPFGINIWIKEGKIDEAHKSKANPGESARAKGEGEV